MRTVHNLRSDDTTSKRLGTVLADRLQRELGVREVKFRQAPSPLAGGRFSSLYGFELVTSPEGWPRSFVVRLVEPADQVRLEVGLHTAAHAEGLTAPRVLYWEAEPDELGVGFMVMERLPHRTYLRGVEPWKFAVDLPKLLGTWPERLADAIAALARVDAAEAMKTIERLGVAPDLARPGRHLRTISKALAVVPSLEGVVTWLHDNHPGPPARLAIVHGDLWPGNVVIDKGQVQLIDWTRGGIDDPALDVGFAKVGFALMPEPFPPPAPIRELIALAGRSIANGISSRCDEVVGGSDRVRYYEALRCAVELADVAAARDTGSVAGWEHGVPALAQHLESITGHTVTFA